MTCIELQDSLAEAGNGASAEQRAHLKTCPECSTLVSELALIASTAAELREADEPSPRVWNSIEIALRQEGLVRPQRDGHSAIRSARSNWAWAGWLVPVAAVLSIAIGLRIHQLRETSPMSVLQPGPQASADLIVTGLNDDDLIQEVSTQTPVAQKQYAENLRHVNDSIRDAQDGVKADPNDEDARRSLLEACQQKAMLFELAMDRSVP